MKFSKNVLSYVVTVSAALSIVNAEDTFNYDRTSGDSYGPDDWDRVKCDKLEECVSINELFFLKK